MLSAAGQPFENAFAGRAEVHRHLATVAAPTPALHHAPPRQPVDELHDAVVLHLQALGERADRGGAAAVEALDLEQDEVLLRLDAGRPCRQLTEAEKPPQVVAKVGQRSVVDRGRARPRHQ